jgi:hypothetical protein
MNLMRVIEDLRSFSNFVSLVSSSRVRVLTGAFCTQVDREDTANGERNPITSLRGTKQSQTIQGEPANRGLLIIVI